jgi:hypothetical protein
MPENPLTPDLPLEDLEGEVWVHGIIYCHWYFRASTVKIAASIVVD